MKTMILTIAASFFALAAVNADKAEETTVTGDVKCAHCDLKLQSSCQNAIQTTDMSIYFLDGKIAEKFFDENEDVKKVTATGEVTKKDEHFVLKASKVEAVEG